MSILDNFEVVEVPRTYSVAQVRVLKNRISFNMSTASELGYPPYVRVFISRDKSQVALQPCDKMTPNAMRFFTVGEKGKRKRRTIGVGNRALAALIKSGMGWDMKTVLCAPGVRFSDENVIIFDLRQSYHQGDKHGSTGLCVIPTPAAPFFQVPAEYFSDVQVVDAKFEEVS